MGAAILTLAGGVSGIVRMAVAVLLCTLIVWPIAHLDGKRGGRAELEAEQAVAVVAAEKARMRDDGIVSGLSDYDLCARANRADGLPVTGCDSLRGFSAGQPDE